MICIYHSRDLDGWTSGAIVKLKYPNAKMIGYDYGQPFPWDEITPSEVVMMVDVSLKVPEMLALAVGCSSLIWIDHHISAINDYKEKIGEGHFRAILDDKISACEATWNYLFGTQQMPECVKLLGEYDTWRKSDLQRWEVSILPFQFGMRTMCQSVETFPIHLFNDDLKDIVEVIRYGNVILKYQQQMNELQCKRAFESGLTFAPELRAICHNAGGFNSDLFKSVYDETKHDIMVMFQYDGKNEIWVFSLYSTKPEVDCSVLAKKMGGGGHKGAAGFQAKGYNQVFDTAPVFN